MPSALRLARRPELVLCHDALMRLDSAFDAIARLGGVGGQLPNDFIGAGRQIIGSARQHHELADL